MTDLQGKWSTINEEAGENFHRDIMITENRYPIPRWKENQSIIQNNFGRHSQRKQNISYVARFIFL